MFTKKKLVLSFCYALLVGWLAGCSGKETSNDVGPNEAAQLASETEETETVAVRFGGTPLAMPPETINANPEDNASRNAYFGDLHVHTNYSFDAFAFGTVASPYDAYRFAKGEAIKHPAGFDVRLRAPLDFYAVTNHAMFLGAVKEAADTTTDFSRYGHVQDLHKHGPADLWTNARCRGRSGRGLHSDQARPGGRRCARDGRGGVGNGCARQAVRQAAQRHG